MGALCLALVLAMPNLCTLSDVACQLSTQQVNACAMWWLVLSTVLLDTCTAGKGRLGSQCSRHPDAGAAVYFDQWGLRACMPSWMGASTPLPPCAVRTCSLCMAVVLKPTDCFPDRAIGCRRYATNTGLRHLHELRALGACQGYGCRPP